MYITATLWLFFYQSLFDYAYSHILHWLSIIIFHSYQHCQRCGKMDLRQICVTNNTQRKKQAPEITMRMQVVYTDSELMARQPKHLTVVPNKCNFIMFPSKRKDIPVLVFFPKERHNNTIYLWSLWHTIEIQLTSWILLYRFFYEELYKKSRIVDKINLHIFANYLRTLQHWSIHTSDYANEILLAPNILSFQSLEGPGCVCLGPTEPNQADPFVKQQPVMLLAQALRRGSEGQHTTAAHCSP